MEKHPVTQATINITPGQHQYWGHLRGCSASLALAHTALKQNKPCVLITANNQQLQQIQTELQFFLAEHDIPILAFPDWETLPYDHFSPHDEIISDRLTVLARLPQLQQGILLVTANTLLQRLAPTNFVASQSFSMQCGEELNLTTLREQLIQAGYHSVSQVYEHGEFVLRGSVLDLYPMGSELPYRIDFFDNEIDSIRTFDTDTQRSIDKIDSINLLPAREFPVTEDGIRQFRQQWRVHFHGDPTQSTIYNDVSQGLLPAGIEYYLPLFFTETASLLDYISTESLIFRLPQLGPTVEQFYQDVQKRHEQCAHDITRPILKPHQLYLSPDDVFKRLHDYAQIDLQEAPAHAKPGNQDFACADLANVQINAKLQQPLRELQQFLSVTDTRVLICAETMGRREVLLELFRTHQIQIITVNTWQEFIASEHPLALCVAPIERSCVLHQPTLSIISETALYGQQLITRRAQERKVTDPDAIIRDLTELHLNDPIVHSNYGVGRYLGLETLAIDGTTNEFLTLEYANQDKIYVPVANLDLIRKSVV